jgi:hypothetical protein
MALEDKNLFPPHSGQNRSELQCSKFRLLFLYYLALAEPP